MFDKWRINSGEFKVKGVNRHKSKHIDYKTKLLMQKAFYNYEF